MGLGAAALGAYTVYKYRIRVIRYLKSL